MNDGSTAQRIGGNFRLPARSFAIDHAAGAASPVAEEGEAPGLERSIGPEGMSKRYTADYWRQRAKEARAVALQLRHPDRRRTMLDIAAGYERMARVAECSETRANESQAFTPK